MKSETLITSEGREQFLGPEFVFTNPDTLLFLTGAPLSGKSTIAPLISASIEGCAQQSMDLIRLMAKRAELAKPEHERNPFVQYGSCDSYLFVGDGSYSSESLIEGFNEYSMAVSSLVLDLLPELEAQGVRNLLFEGVQLTPQLVAPFLTGNNKLIILASSAQQMESNRRKLLGDDPILAERYSIDKLLRIQKEIINQSMQINPSKVIYLDNVFDPRNIAKNALDALMERDVITPRGGIN